MKNKKNGIITLLIVLLSIAAATARNSADSVKAPCITCDALKTLRLPDVTVIETSMENEGVAFCKLLGVIGTEINFELLLPTAWNNRFAMGGGGGFVGSIQNMARSSVMEGYATVGTDTGHKGNGLKADWALNNMERQVNFGHLAVHRTAEVAKAIINEYYCSYPVFSYFMGCSRGGGQALIEAQRYPGDFDGIVSACPVIDWPATGAEFIQNIRALYPNPSKIDVATVSPEHIKILQEEVYRQCDLIDGIKDQIINDPGKCDFDFAKLPVCPEGQARNDCFTPRQIEVIKTIYNGVSVGSTEIYPGFPFGCENEQGGWLPWIVGPDKGTMALNFPSLHFGFGTEMFKYLVFQDPSWDYSTYDFTNLIKDSRYASAYLNATNTDYSGFKNRKGKLIIWHGWNDPALSAYTSIQHYEAAKKIDGELENYIRLFLLPGVLHCGSGPGPSNADWLKIVHDWVENGKAPERIIVSKSENNKTVMTRPVFPYPKIAFYKGSGDPNQENSFNAK